MRVLPIVACCVTSIMLPVYADEPIQEEAALCATIQSGQWAERELGSFESCLQLTRSQVSAERIRFGRWGTVLIAYDGSGFLISGDEGQRWKLLQSLELPVQATPLSADPAEAAPAEEPAKDDGSSEGDLNQEAGSGSPAMADPMAAPDMTEPAGGEATDTGGDPAEHEESTTAGSLDAPIGGGLLQEHVTEPAAESAPQPSPDAVPGESSGEPEAVRDSGSDPPAVEISEELNSRPDAAPEVGPADPATEATVEPDSTEKQPASAAEPPLQTSSATVSNPDRCRIKSSDRWVQSHAPSLLVCARLLDQSPEIYDQNGYKYAYWREQLLAATRYEVYAIDQESQRTLVLKRHRYPSNQGPANTDSRP